MTDLPKTMTIDGVTYVREDSIVSGMANPFEESYSIAELVELTGFKRRTIYSFIEDGELVAIRPHGGGRGMRVMRSDWDAFVEARRAEATSRMRR